MIEERIWRICLTLYCSSRVRAVIDEYEWFVATSHWHEPLRAVIKYRLALLPDRNILPDEYEAVIEALGELLHGCLNRDVNRAGIAGGSNS